MNDNTNKIIDNNYEWKTIVIPNQIIFSNDGDVIKISLNNENYYEDFTNSKVEIVNYFCDEGINVIRINKTKLYISSLNSYNKNISKRITKSCYFKIKKG